MSKENSASPRLRGRFSSNKHREGGVALVIVLAFVVLLTGLLLAFFSRTISERQVSNSSASQSKVDIFAQGAVDTVIGNLMQEIILGSSATTVTTGSVTSTIYLPLAPAYMVPALVGSSGSNGLQNLVKRSATGQAFFPAGPATCASACSSTTTSQNGRYISPARWNKPFLIPSASGTDNTPATSTGYVPPDWILVARNSSNPTSWSSNMVSSVSNSTSVVGRFAYAIYDEGGLLDVNAAGYPSTTSPSQSAYKPSLAFADLTQIGLTQTQCDELVAWRNWASAQATGTSFSNPGFTPASGTNYFNVITSNSTGFLTNNSNTFNGGQTDRMFTSRQLLINFLQNGVGLSGTTLQNALLYLTTFTRELNQPSLVPALTYNPTTAPTILPSASGGNNANGGDSPTLVSSSTDGRINPMFLAVRVQTPFTRNDGSLTAIGDPLVKSRFNLNRLAWLTYAGPSSTRNIANPLASGSDADIYTLENSYGISQSWLKQGTATNILNYFGLQWSGTGWTYVHTNATTGAINTLNQVAHSGNGTAREPDFVELLKASINAGALGKSAASGTGNPVTTPYATNFATDNSVDYQILQIFANIIDQFTTDGYPTDIHWANSGNTQDFVGIKNLPYLNRVRALVVKVQQSNPPFYGTSGANAGKDQLTSNAYLNSGNGTYYTNGATQQTANGPFTLQNTGIGVILWYPEVWNPHGWTPANLNQTFGNPAPTNFQIYGVTDVNGVASSSFYLYPRGNSTGGSLTSLNYAAYNSINAVPSLSPGAFQSTTFSPQNHLTAANTQMNFSIPWNTQPTVAAALFREPTLLFKPNLPSGCNLSGSGLASVISASAGGSMPNLTAYKGTNNGLLMASSIPKDNVLQDPSGQEYVGFYVNAYPLSWVANVAYSASSSWVVTGGTAFTSSTTYYVLSPQCGDGEGTMISAIPGTQNSPTIDLSCVLQYQNASGAWVTYDKKYGQNPGTNDDLGWAPNSGIMDQSVSDMSCVTCFDPRTSRFGLNIGESGYGGSSPSGGVHGTPTHASSFPPFPQNFSGLGNPGTSGTGWVDLANGVLWSTRMGASSGAGLSAFNTGNPWYFSTSIGWYPGNGNSPQWGKWTSPMRPGLFEQNNPLCSDDGLSFDGDKVSSGVNLTGPNYYSDADGVVRRAAGAWITGGNTGAAGSTPGTTPSSATTTVGLPLAVANSSSGGVMTQTNQSSSRPIILNRPFRSVAELGYTFSGTPFKNLDFFTPESGYAGLLDTFCTNDTGNPTSLGAGKVNLNTRQPLVLQAILSGAYRDEWNAAGTTVPGGAGSLAASVANALVQRTTTGPSSGPVAKIPQPLRNMSELVGKWVQGMNPTGSAPASAPPYGPSSYDGFSADLQSVLTSSTDTNIQRFNEATMRALSNSGQTRVWNLMIDVIAQTGRYPQSATGLNNFIVEGEQRYWVHVAIDRFTGQIIDKQIEVVKE